MRKSDKKLENALRKALTKVCDHALYRLDGFVWITHLVDYNIYPKSLRIVCVFNQEKMLEKALAEKQDALLFQLINDELTTLGIALKNVSQYVSFDTEEACLKSHQGNWNARFQRSLIH